MEDPKPNNEPEQEALDEWHHIQTQLPQSSSSESHPNEWEMPITRENYVQEINSKPSSSVFPPSQREGLDLEPHDSPSLSSSSLPSDDDDDDLKKLQPSSRRSAFEMLKYGVFGVVLRIRNYYVAAFRGRFWALFGSAVGVAVVVVAAFRLYVNVKMWRRGRRRKAEEEWRKGLVHMVQEKDQKINKLLLQMAQLNKLIAARHKVPVIRVE